MNSSKNQFRMLGLQPKAYGGILLKTRKGRSLPRPLDTRNSMHLVLRSSKATGEFSFWRPKNKARIQEIIGKFSKKYGVKIYSIANVGNHLHLHIKLSNRFSYAPFIRATTSAIAMAVSGVNRWNKMVIPKKLQPEENSVAKKNSTGKRGSGHHFWDYRPYTRVVLGLKAYLNLRDYIRLNQLEGFGVTKTQGRFLLNRLELKSSGGFG
jgi:REP element-mobilizing transposase RayT